MARRRRLTDEELLAVARLCFLEDPNVSTSAIAARAGVSQATLFKRFGTKLRLLLAALGVRQGPPWVALCARGPDERPIPEQLEELGLALASFFRLLVPRVAAMRAVGVDFGAMFGDDAVPPPVIGHQALRGWFERAIAAGRVRDHDPGTLAIAFLGMFQARAFWDHVAGRRFPEHFPVEDDDHAHVARVVALFWSGAAPTEEG